jgi:predicted DNA-binding transcriptional regulator AlpA
MACDFVSFKEFTDLLGIKKSTMYKLLKDSKLPEPISIFSRHKVWRRDVVEEFLRTIA